MFRPGKINSQIIVGAIFLIVFALLPLFGSKYSLYLNSQVLFMVLFAMSLNILVGYTGLFSFGHVAYFAIGAYIFAIFMHNLGLPFWVAFISGPIVAALLAAVFGLFCVRLTKTYFTFLTLAFAQIVWAIAFKWTPITGGDSGIAGITMPDFLVSMTNSYYFTFGVVAVMVLAIYQILHSPYGLILNAIRDNPNRAEFIGINVKKYQLIAFTIAGFFAGMAGVLFVLLTRSVFPDIILVSRSVEVIIMVVLGGMYNFWGPSIGAIILVYLNDFIKAQVEYWPLFLGLIVAILIFFFPNGIVGIVESVHQRWKRRAVAHTEKP